MLYPFFFNDTATTEIYPLSLHDALPISTGNLDSRTGEEIIELLCALRLERQSTMIIATHDSKVAARAPKVLELLDGRIVEDRKSTRLNSSHSQISYAVFCLNKKKSYQTS